MLLSILLCKRKRPILAFSRGSTSIRGGDVLPHYPRVGLAQRNPTCGDRRSLRSVPFLYTMHF